MDRFIRDIAEQDGDLIICRSRGLAYQADMSAPVKYDKAYFDKYEKYEKTEIGRNINQERLWFLSRHAVKGSRVLDVGACNGAFVRGAIALGYMAYGFDVIPESVERLKVADRYEDNPAGFDVVTFWDSLEHIENPGIWLDRIDTGSVVIVAVPIFTDLDRIRDSKHYRPNEHFYYFTTRGFIDWMAMRGYRLIESSGHEMKAGRESIGAFAMRKT